MSGIKAGRRNCGKMRKDSRKNRRMVANEVRSGTSIAEQLNVAHRCQWKQLLRTLVSVMDFFAKQKMSLFGVNQRKGWTKPLERNHLCQDC